MVIEPSIFTASCCLCTKGTKKAKFTPCGSFGFSFPQNAFRLDLIGQRIQLHHTTLSHWLDAQPMRACRPIPNLTASHCDVTSLAFRTQVIDCCNQTRTRLHLDLQEKPAPTSLGCTSQKRGVPMVILSAPVPEPCQLPCPDTQCVAHLV